MSRRKYTSKFKTKVVLEAIREKHALAELAQLYEVHPQQISNWKLEFLNNADQVFDKGKKSKKSESEEEEDQLLKVIGQLKVENDSCLLTAGRQVLKNALR